MIKYWYKKISVITWFFSFLTSFSLVFLHEIYIPLQESEQDRPLAIVRRFKPIVELSSINKRTIELDLEKNIGEKLFNGDTLTTNADGYALVIFMDNSIAKVKPTSELIVRGFEQPSSKNTIRRIDLEKGQIFLDVEPQGSGSFEVATDKAIASVKGTRFGSNADGFIWVEEGQVDVNAANSDEKVSLFEQMYAQVDEAGITIETGKITPDELENFQKGYDVLEEDIMEKEIKLRFRDLNGEIREITIPIFEKRN